MTEKHGKFDQNDRPADAGRKPWRKPEMVRLSLAETKEGVISFPVENPFGFGLLGTNV